MNDGMSKQDDGSSATVLSRTTIREANNHLQMLHKRNQELEACVVQHTEELRRKDFEYRALFQANQLLEKHCQQLQLLLDDRTRRLQAFEKKEVLFRETLELKPAIESLLEVLNTFEKEDSNALHSRLHFRKNNADDDHKAEAV
jgi:aspartate oxidase